MKKTILLTLLVLSMSLSATAIYDPNNTHTSSNGSGPQILKATSGPNATVEIPDYQMTFMQQEGACGASNADNVSITPLKVSPDDNTVKIEGIFQTPHPNYNLTSNVEKTGEKQYILRINGVETSKVAPRCIGNINYHAHLTAPEDSTFKVYHNETKVAEKQVSESVGNPSENETENSLEKTQEKQKGLIQGIIEALIELF